MKSTHSKSSLFLMEILLNIVLFSVLVIIGMQFFVHTHTLTNKTRQLHLAVNSCTNVASVFEAGDGTLENILKVYPYSVNMDNKIVIYLDKNFNDCKKGQAQYYITARLSADSTKQLPHLILHCRSTDQELLYELNVSHYRQLRTSTDVQLKGVD